MGRFLFWAEASEGRAISILCAVLVICGETWPEANVPRSGSFNPPSGLDPRPANLYPAMELPYLHTAHRNDEIMSVILSHLVLMLFSNTITAGHYNSPYHKFCHLNEFKLCNTRVRVYTAYWYFLILEQVSCIISSDLSSLCQSSPLSVIRYDIKSITQSSIKNDTRWRRGSLG